MDATPDSGILARFHRREPRNGEVQLVISRRPEGWSAAIASPLRVGHMPLVIENLPLDLAVRMAAEVALRCDRDVALADPEGVCDDRILAALLMPRAMARRQRPGPEPVSGPVHARHA